MNPYTILLLPAVFTLAVAGAYLHGQRVCNAEHEAKAEVAAEAQRMANRAALLHYERQRKEHEAKQKQLRLELAQILMRPGYERDCLDADGVRLTNDALTGRTERTP